MVASEIKSQFENHLKILQPWHHPPPSSYFIADEVGLIEQEFEGDPVVLEIHVFQTRKFLGSLIETEEMRPQWFPEADIPFKQMWLDDELWYPHLLKNDKFKGYFLFKGHDKILDYTLTVL